MTSNAKIRERPILITGGVGFIGSHLVRRLLRDGHRVVVLMKKTSNPNRIKNVLSQIKIVHDDLSDTVRLKRLIQGVNPCGVFHCAASTIKSGVSASEDELIKVNLAGTMHLVKALEKIDYEFFINCGTLVEYGTKNRPPKETDLCEPVETYALTKLAATLYCQSVARGAGKPIVTFRIFTPYGPNMEEGRLVYEVVKRARENREIILTQPEVNRDFVFIDDLVELFIEAADKAPVLSGEIFNVGTGKATTLKDFVELVMRLTNSKSAIRWGSAQDVPYDQACWQANMRKTFKAFSWRPSRDLDFGLHRMVEWFSSHKELE